MQTAIFIACCFIIGMLVMVCLELRLLRDDVADSEARILNTILTVTRWIRDDIPNTFEYNGMRGKVFKK